MILGFQPSATFPVTYELTASSLTPLPPVLYSPLSSSPRCRPLPPDAVPPPLSASIEIRQQQLRRGKWWQRQRTGRPPGRRRRDILSAGPLIRCQPSPRIYLPQPESVRANLHHPGSQSPVPNPYNLIESQQGMDSAKKVRGYVVWTDQMDEALLNIFVDHYNKGDRAQNSWKPYVYTAAVKNIREKCNVDITKENIISRSKTFDRYYTIISKMLSRSGFGWDWDHNKISVDNEDMWNNYVKENKEAACYRHKVIKF